MKKITILFLALQYIWLVQAQNAENLSLYFSSKVKVNALYTDRGDIQHFFGEVLGRKIESHDYFDKINFDGGGFIAYVYQEDEDRVLQKSSFENSMQIAIEVPESQYQEVENLIRKSEVELYIPTDNRFPHEQEKLHFHAPGSQIFKLEKRKPALLIQEPENVYDEKMALAYGADDYGMKKYVMAFLRRGPNPAEDPQRAAEIQSAHLQNIMRMAEEGWLILAGPFFGKGDLRGIYLFDVDSIEEARKLTSTDPAIQEGTLEMELIEWYGSAALMAIPELTQSVSKKSIVE